MKITPHGIAASLTFWPRRARCLVAWGAALGATAAWAQNAVSTFVGTVGTPGYANTAPGTFRFTNPSGIAVDATGNLFVADPVNNVIRRVTAAGVISTFAGAAPTGTAAAVAGSADGSGVAASFNGPQGIAIDGAGNVFVADTNNHAIRMITSGGVVTTLAGTAGAGVTVTSGYVNGNGTAALFRSPLGVATDRAGPGGAAVNVYVADTNNNVIRQIVVATGAVTTLAGAAPVGGAAAPSGPYADGAGATATFFHPDGIVANAAGTTLYVADTFNNRVRRIVVAAGPTVTVSLLAGSGTSAYAEGSGAFASFNGPTGLALDGSGNVLVADSTSHVIRLVTPGGVTSQYAGTGNSSGNTNGLATSVARFNVPSGVAFDGSTNAVYVTDTNNQTIRRIAAAQAPSITGLVSAPAYTVGSGIMSAAIGTSPTITVTATGNPPVSYQWQRQRTGESVFSNLSTADANYAGVTGATLTINNVSAGMNGDKFQVVVSNGFGSNAISTPQITLAVPQPTVFTSAATTTFTVGIPSSFPVTTTGSPTAMLSQPSGSFPSWASFNANSSGGATIVAPSGPPDALTPQYIFTIRADNGIGGIVDQVFTLNVGTLSVAPVITSASSYSFTVGHFNSFTFTATGTPTPTITVTPLSTLPANVNLSGTTLTGSPTTTAGAPVSFQVTAASSSGTTSQTFTLNVVNPQPPTFISASNTSFASGTNGTFTVAALGAPAPTFTADGNFPSSWATLNPVTGVITGVPPPGTPAQTTFVLTAQNSAGTATQVFTLTVTAAPPVIVSHPVGTTVNVGQNASFHASASGTPTPTLRWQRLQSGAGVFVDLTEGGAYANVTSETLTIVNVTAEMNGDQFRLLARNEFGASTASSSAPLNVNLGTAIVTIAGQALVPGIVNATGTSARFNTPSGIAVDFSGNIYIADTANHVIRKMTPAGAVTTLAGLAGVSGSTNGSLGEARFNAPQAVAVDSVGTVFVADTFNHTIRIISTSGVVSTLAGSPGVSGTLDGTGPDARFFLPAGIVVDNGGTVYVADTSNHAIRRVQSNGVVTTFAGVIGVPGLVNDFVGTSARFTFPNGLAFDNSGNLYVADTFNHAIRRIASNGSVSTAAGNGNPGSADGTGTAASFNRPYDVVSDNLGNIYVADTYNSTIRKIVFGSEVSTLAGFPTVTGSADGAGGTVRFNQPFGIALDVAGNLYITDTRNHTLRRSGSTSAPQIVNQPAHRLAAIGMATSISVTASGSPPPSYQWYRQRVNTDGFLPLTNDGVYADVTTATLRILNVTPEMAGDQFRVSASNGILPTATSEASILTIGTAPVITSPASATFQAGQAGSFSVTATSSPSPVYGATGLPAWAAISPVTGQITGTPPDTSGSPFTVIVTASNGITVSQNLTLTVTPAMQPPTITVQPAGTTASQGQAVTFSVTAGGTPPLSYQWRRNGGAINGATSSSLQLSNVQAAAEGVYSVSITNVAGSTVSAGANLSVNAVPVLTLQPRSQTALAGGGVTFSVSAIGGTGFGYQWRKNGQPIAGANSSSLTLSGLGTGDVGNYDVLVSNGVGAVGSSLAQLTVVTTSVAPVITSQPAARTVTVGTGVTLAVDATGVPTPTYQWRKNGSTITGANAATYSFPAVQAGDAANYDVVVSNAAGSVTSAPAGLTVLARSYAGVYFGSLSGGLGDLALYVREDNTGVFLAYLPGSSAPVMSLSVRVTDSGQFFFSQGAIGASFPTVLVAGSIAPDGTLTGSIQGGASGTISGARAADSGGSQGLAGFYQAGSSNNAAIAYTIAGPNNVAFVVVQSGAVTEGGRGTLSNTGVVTVATTRSSIVETIDFATGSIAGNSIGAVAATFNGGSDTTLGRQRLVNISSRARVATGDAVAIAGFVISGEESKPVLIRAVGPTIGTAPFNVPGALAAPRLELFRGTTSLAVNTGISGNRAAIDAAGQQAAAFPLGAAGTDAAILTTLAPGNYTAVVSSATNTAGVALVEVYDLSGAAPGQKLLNIATRAAAGTNENTLIAGFVVPPGPAKRVLVRGIGPGLTPFSVNGVLAQPSLVLLNSSNTPVAQNTNWNTSADASVIPAASAQVGAFPLATLDSALIVTLAPGNYTAQVVGVGGTTGVALIEVYELP